MDLHVNCCSKYFLFTFNTIFWIVSLVFIAVASWAWHTKGFFDSLDEVTGIPVGTVLSISVGKADGQASGGSTSSWGL